MSKIKLIIKQAVFYSLLFIAFHGHAQLSKVHYIPPLTSSDQGNADPIDQYFYISTPSEELISFKIIPSGSEDSDHIEGQVSRDSPYVYTISNGGFSQLVVDPVSTSQVFSNKGYIVEADTPIYVSVRMNAGNYAQAGALVSKGENALGTEFRIGTYNNQGSPQTNYLNFFSVMATEDNTRVNLSNNITSGLVIQNFGNNQFPVENILLNKGDSYIVAAKVTDNNGTIINQNRDGLIGTLVSSNKPVVVNCGSANGSFGNGGARDYGFDQIVGADKIGDEYIFVRGDGQDSYENILLVANQDDTYVWINGSSSPINVDPIAAGEHIVIEGDAYEGGNLYVRASENVFAYQGIGGASEANQGMFFVPPLSCENRGNIDNIALIEQIGSITYSGGITIVTKRNSIVKINNTLIENLNSVLVVGPSDVTGRSDYITYKIRGLNGNIGVSSSDELYAAYFNFNGSASSGSFYSGFPSAPELDIDFTATRLGTCISAAGISNVVLSVSNEGNFDSLQWYKKNPLNNENISVNNGESSTFHPSEPGNYLVIGVINCSGTSYTSKLIPISICPPDFDEDGIIDNFDLDNDNDGILDSVESNGDEVINLSDPLNPSTPTELTLNALLLKTEGSENIFLGTATGYFESELAPSLNSSLSYALNFSENVSLKISEDQTKTRTENPEDTFIWSTSSEEINISLWDPGDRLLVDSNFDGIFETGVTVFTGAEVRFKFNPNSINATPFEFFSKNTAGIILKQIQKNPKVASLYFGKIELIDRYLDTDEDGLMDLFDSDSDADGCYDLFEAGFGTSDPDYNGVMGTDSVSYDLGTIDNRGRFIDHDYSLIPIRNLEDDFQFQIFNTAPQIISQPESVVRCGGFTSSFSVFASHTGSTYYQWQFNVTSTIWEDVIEDEYFSGSNQTTLTLLNSQEFHSGTYRVQVFSDDYACPINSDEVLLTVQPVVPPPVLEQEQVFCFDVINPAKIDDLSVVSTDTFDRTEWYITSKGGSPLATSTILIDGQEYFAQFLDSNNCSSYERTMTSVFIAPLPDIIHPIFYIKQCDEDEENDGRSLFNLEEYAGYLSTTPASETFEFFTSSDFSLNSKISSPTRFQNEAFQQQVFVKITSPYGCIASATLDIRIGASNIDPDFMVYYALCEDDPANDQDGLLTFGSQIITEIKNTLIESDIKYSSQSLSINLYSSLDDALIKRNPLDTNDSYTTQTSGTQEIWANIENVDLDEVNCVGLKQIATLYVEPKPISNEVFISRACDGNSPLDEDSFDGLFPFETSNIQNELLGGQTDILTHYFNSSGIEIGTILPNPFLTASQTIRIELEKISALEDVVNPDGNCIDAVFISFKVDSIPEINNLIMPEQCDNGVDIADGISAFDTENIIKDLLYGSQPNQNTSNTLIQFEYTDLSGITQLVNQLPNPFFSSTQQVTVTLKRALNSECSVSSLLNFVVNSIPVVNTNQEIIRCTNLNPEPIGFLESGSDQYSFDWVFISTTGERIYLSDTTATIYPEAAGSYEFTATTLDGTYCTLTTRIEVTDSMAAEILNENIIIKDLNREGGTSIEIIIKGLGNGDFEFSLNSETGPYKEEPIFNDVESGPFTLYIKDRNGCGITAFESVALNYKKFFSPNGDGINDVWFIEGITQFFEAGSSIQIFGRNGKLLKSLNPIGPGWDGMYNDKQMPQDDYWFLYTSEEGRRVQGHFSLLR
ncbi:MAG: T9SS type B sorting domain-containing protein [Flavobacteriaceae bacterium]|nr:T9SS type B sorting domain-containing protein [Flavobacteriaceae bacterium]